MIEKYFSDLREGLDQAYAIASEARKKGFDPVDEVEVKIAKDVAARVEGIVGPPGIAKIIRELIENGLSREDAAFEITRRIASGTIITGDKERLIEQAVRTGVGILTEGVLVAPTEGIAKVKIKQNPDGSDFVAVYFSGPIRSAGGTAAALSLVLADIARRVVGVRDYRATDTQLERYVEEINMYEARVNHLQYKPPDDDIRHIVKNCPICVDGDPTEEMEVSAYRGVPGVETNRIRGGMPLVVCEGVAQKAAKLAKYTKKLNLGWDWLEKVIKIKRKEDKIEIKPDDTYLEGLVAGRPVFSHASAKGGFRLRYGRSKTNSIMAKNIHSATMVLLDGFPAFGTHFKIERPGKGCVISGHDGLEPPVVLLDDGSVQRVRDIKEAQKVLPFVKQILFLGDMLMTYGDFLKSNHPLIPSGWCLEWWVKEVEAKGVIPKTKLNAKEAFDFSKLHDVPLHPDHTHNWCDISNEQALSLVKWLESCQPSWNGESLSELSIPLAEDDGKGKRALEELLVPHRVADGKIFLTGDDGYSILASLGAIDQNGKTISLEKAKIALEHSKDLLPALNSLSGIIIKSKSPTYIGGRMGRPEKAFERAMDGKPHVIFPTGSQKNRSFVRLYKTLKLKDRERNLNLDLVRYKCPSCSNITFTRICERCKSLATLDSICQVCGRSVQGAEHCDRKTHMYDRRPVDLISLMDSVKLKVGFMPNDVKGLKGLSNIMRVPERLEKGFLRAKHDVYIFRDGTSRFDATDIPLTAFTPEEIGLTLERALSLGYAVDIHGNPLIDVKQTVYLYPQDILMSSHGMDYFMRVANFIDEMLVNLYGLKPFYSLKKREDLVGHLCLGLSPHTSAGVLVRIIGYTNANVGYGHPYFHTAKRRNCFHPSTRLKLYKKRSVMECEISQIVESEFQENPDKIKRLDAHTEKIDLSRNMFIESIDSKTNKIIRKRITCLIRSAAPEYWIEIELESGKRKAVTPDHNILYKLNDILNVTAAESAKEGMLVPTKSADGHYVCEKIVKIRKFNETINAYCLDIDTEGNNLIEKNILLANGMFSIRCDGDEDCVMLLMDALINFSRKYLNESRGGTMDAPLVLTPAIDPSEVDDEVHCVEFVTSYPLEFYRACEKITPPGEFKLKTVKNILGKPEQYTGLLITHEGGTLDQGPTTTKYVQLGNIPEKITTQFNLQLRIRAVDAKNAAERLILSHFIPDLYGNLRSFSRQTFRCSSCNHMHRRPPLSGKCIVCGGNLILTINKGGIQKYLEISRRICVEYDLPIYLKQRLVLVEREIRSIFEDDKIKQTGLAEFL